MVYNPFEKLRDGEFSWKEDSLQTLDDIFTVTGINALVRKMDQIRFFNSRLYGNPETNERLVKGAYLCGSGIIIYGVFTNPWYCSVVGGALILGNLAHHFDNKYYTEASPPSNN